MPRLSPLSYLVLRTAAVAASAGALWTFAAPPAVAGPLEPIQIEATDLAGDARYEGKKQEAGADITGFSITQDREAKKVRGKVTFAGEVTELERHHLRIALGIDTGRGYCQIFNIYGPIHIRHLMGTGLADYAVATNIDVRQPVSLTHGVNEISFETPAAPDAFGGAGHRCIIVQTERVLDERTADSDNPYDQAIGFAPAVIATPVNTPPVLQAPPAPGGGPAVILDADNDGVHDGIDKCPQQAGAATTGCESVPVAKSIKLGTKRVVVDRLLSTTSGVCPSAVKVTVTLKGKTLAKQKLGTLKKGKFCHVLGVVTLKKKAAKARVAITGTGIVAVALTVKK